MNDSEQESLRNLVIDFFKRADNDYRDAVRNVPEKFNPKESVSLSTKINQVLETKWFESASIFLIITAAILTGIQVEYSEYYANHPDSVINTIDLICVYLFCVECLLRILAEGNEPWRYFLGSSFLPEQEEEDSGGGEGSKLSFFESLKLSKWEGRAKWRCFEFFISYAALIFSYSTFGTGEAGGYVNSLLLLRAVRLLTIVDRFEELKVIMDGFVEGLQSFIYIAMILIMVFYVYAILGFYLFGDNDPAHFGTLGAALVSLLRTATLSAWYELLYINWYGCDLYTGGDYRLATGLSPAKSDINDDAYVQLDDPSYEQPNKGPFMYDTGYGLFPDFICWNPTPKPGTAFIFFFSYTLISSFVILSLLVGAVTISMQETMEKIHKLNLRNRRDQKLTNNKIYDPRLYTRYVYGGKTGKELQLDPSTGLPYTESLSPLVLRREPLCRSEKMNGVSASKVKRSDVPEEVDFVFGIETPVRATLKHLMKLCIRGRYEVSYDHMPGSLGAEAEEEDMSMRLLKALYLSFGSWCEWFVGTTLFSALVVSMIALFAVLVGVETAYPDNSVIIALHLFCTVAYVVECVIKLASFKMRPSLYFMDYFNTFDFVIAIGGVVIAVSGSGYREVSLARLLRLIQVFKLATRLPRLQLVTESLLYGLKSMMWVALLFALFNYLFALMGIMLFRSNDPFYFGNILRSVQTLWNVETLNNWQHPMFVNVFGCANYGYGELGKGVRLGETAEVIGECNHSNSLGGVAVVYFCVVVGVGGLILPTLLTAVITAFTVHMGANKKEREEHAEKLQRIVSIAPTYLNPKRVALLEELFENLDVSGDGSLAPEELLPAFTALSDDVLRHSNPTFIKKLFNMVDKSEDGNVDISEFLSFFCRLASAMALRLGKPTDEFIEDPVVFEQQFVVLCLELARGADGGSRSSTAVILAEQELENEQQNQEINARDVARIQRSGAVGAELMGDISTLAGAQALGTNAFGLSHQPSSIFDVYQPEQLHKHIRWLASRLEAKSSEAAAVKKELNKLKLLLGAFDHTTSDAVTRPHPVPGQVATPDMHPEVARSKRVKKLTERIMKEAHIGYREQWEAKVASAANLKQGMVSAAASAVLNGSQILSQVGKPLLPSAAHGSTMNNPNMGGTSADRRNYLSHSSSNQSYLENTNPLSDSLTRSRGRQIDEEKYSSSVEGREGGINNLTTMSPIHEFDDAYSIGALITANTAFLANEWQGVFSATSDAVALREEEVNIRRLAAANPDHPVPAWVGRGGWACLADHNRTNLFVTPLPDETKLASAMSMS